MPTFIVGTKVVVASKRRRAIMKAEALGVPDPGMHMFLYGQLCPCGRCGARWRAPSDDHIVVRQLNRRTAQLVRRWLGGDDHFALRGLLLWECGIVPWSMNATTKGASARIYGLLGVRVPRPAHPRIGIGLVMRP